ncbi:hypothetical protein N2152v2_010782 [Parachlorella kessleri]
MRRAWATLALQLASTGHTNPRLLGPGLLAGQPHLEAVSAQLGCPRWSAHLGLAPAGGSVFAVQSFASSAAAPPAVATAAAAGERGGGGGGAKAADKGTRPVSKAAAARQVRSKPRRKGKKRDKGGEELTAADAIKGLGTELEAGLAAAEKGPLEAEAMRPVLELPVGLPQLPARLLEDNEHPIRDGHIARAAWSVLLRLRSVGHEVYLVGGTVRDFLLGRVPKDFDVLTSADPSQVRRLFSRCYTVGRVFPICHVHQDGLLVEVSSFSTKADAARIPPDAAGFLTGRHAKHHLSKVGGLVAVGVERASSQPDAPTWAAARRDNAVRRDFTANALLYEPFSRVVFDYVGGVEDIQRGLLRTIESPEDSFLRDPARILRAIRMAARTGLELEEPTAAAMVAQAPSVAALPAGRLSMELGALMAYGGAARSLELLWRHGMLHLLLPHHATYLKARRVSADYRRRRKPELLFEMLRALDAHVNPQRPLDSAVWLALLAAPLVAKECGAVRARSEAAAKRRGRGKQRDEPLTPTQQQLREGNHVEDPSQDEQLQRQQQAQQPLETGSLVSASQQEIGGTTAVTGGGGPRVTLEYLEAYHQVVRGVMERLQQPLTAGTLRKLGLGDQEAPLLQALAAPPSPAPAAGAPLPADAAAAAAPPEGGRGKASRARLRRDRLRQEAAAAAASAAAAAAGSGPASDEAVLIPASIPRGSVHKAVGLLLTEAEARGLVLHAHRLPGQRRLKYEQRLVAAVLREFDWAELTRLPC